MSVQRSDRPRDELDFAKAKELSLSAFAEAELGVTAKKMGGWLRYNTCFACGEGGKDSVRLAIKTDDRTWKCHRCGDHGSIIDAGMFLWGCDNVEAVRKLLGVSERGPRPVAAVVDRSAEEAAAKRRASLMRLAFSKLQEAAQDFKDQPDCLRYLTQARRIPLEIVRTAQERGMVGFMPSNHRRAKAVMVEALGEDLLRETGLWKPGKELPGIAYRPLVFFLPGMTCAEFRVIVDVPKEWSKSIAHGPKEYPYWWMGTDNQCLMAEGLIDVMSAVALGFRGHVMGLPGCNNIREDWLTKAAARYNIERYVIGLDNDVDDPLNPGQTWAKKISAMCTAANLPSVIKAPERGDLNDILRARFGANKN